MTDSERLDWLEATMRRCIGGGTPERWIDCQVHFTLPIREAIDRAAQQWPDGGMREEDRGEMTNDELAAAIEVLRQQTIENLEDAERELEKKQHDTRANFDRQCQVLAKAAGQRVCPECDGQGYLTRLDAGYMRRFGLREWDGCANCGGKQETRGRGFVPA